MTTEFNVHCYKSTSKELNVITGSEDMRLFYYLILKKSVNTSQVIKHLDLLSLTHKPTYL